MFSGIMERINKIKKLSEGEKAELKESIYYHHDTCRIYLLENPNVSIVIRNSLEDRMIILSQALDKLR
jgi:hypothetical protein